MTPRGFNVGSMILDRFCEKVAQIVQTEGAACFALGAADNSLHPQAVVGLPDGFGLDALEHIDIDADGAFSAAVTEALNEQHSVILTEVVAMAQVSVAPPVMVMPIIWEREALDPDEDPVKRPVGVLGLWGKRGGTDYDDDDYKLASTLSNQAAALLVEEQLEEFDDIQAAFATVPVGLMLISRTNQITVANAAANGILQVDTLQGNSVKDIDYRGQLAHMMDEMHRSEAGNINLAFTAVDNETYTTSAQLTQDGQAILAFTQSPFSTAAEELTGQVAHELRTPLTVIQGNLQTLEFMLEDDLEPEDLEIIREFINSALIQSSRMYRLIDETLNISRIHAGKELELDIAEFDLVEALQQILVELADRLLGHVMDVQVPDKLLIEGDRGKITSIFDNYLKNAAKYADPGTTISVRIYEPEPGLVAMEVEDQGIGIPPEALEKIGKEAGFRTELSKKQAGGIGLGMVYTQRVTEAHGGEMQIESEVGKGSIFRSIIPTTQP